MTNSRTPLAIGLILLIAIGLCINGVKGIMAEDLTTFGKRGVHHYTGQDAVTRGWTALIVGSCVIAIAFVFLRKRAAF